MPSDAKNKAISDLTAECYKQASKLTLTKDEIAGLSADFPDEAFQPGAAGKENLIYIEHASLRERLDQVIGMGQWCMIPIRRWEEPFTYQKEIWINNRRSGQFEEVKGSHVYVDGMMLIRGAFVASAIGEMTYYPDNHTQNYGDAVEGAETAALRRCCKRIGIGLQAWRKDWCLGWWQRRKGPKGKPPGRAPEPPITHSEPEGSFDAAQPAKVVSSPIPDVPKASPEPSVAAATPKHRMKALNLLQAAPGQRNRTLFKDYLMSKGWLTSDQEPEDGWSLANVPATKEAMTVMVEDVSKFEQLRREERAA